MITWTKKTLSECVTFRTGKLNSNAAVEDGMYPFFTCSQEIYKTNTWSFDTECVLLGGNNASAVYPIFYFNGKFDAYQRTYVIEPKNGNSIRFFYYLLRKKLGEFKTQSTGATTKFLTLQILNNIDISVPEIRTQNSISLVLSSYDDLIQNNEERIRILEEMAQRLYTEWFVKFKFPGYKKVKMVDSGTKYGKIPETWEVKEIGDTLDTVKRKTKIRTDQYLPTGNIPVVDQGRDFISGYTDNEASAYNENLIVFGDHTRCFKYCNFRFSCGADGTQLLKTNNNSRMPQILLYLSVLNSGLQNYQYARHFKFLKVLPIILPDINTAQHFSKIIDITFEQINNLRQFNILLGKTRDLLIPQLVTGKRELKY